MSSGEVGGKWVMVGDEGTEAKMTHPLEVSPVSSTATVRRARSRSPTYFPDPYRALPTMICWPSPDCWPPRRIETCSDRTSLRCRTASIRSGLRPSKPLSPSGKKGYQSFSVICPSCQELARFQRWQSKNFLLGFSQFGPWLSGAPSFWGALQK